uniref:Uncharacterized protein n=1 Tax=Oryza punctata TaxID=4537 RepID=A0A0E0JX52_ORYPU
MSEMETVEKLLGVLICREKEKRAKGWEEEEVDKLQMAAAAGGGSSSSSSIKREAIKRNAKTKEADGKEMEEEEGKQVKKTSQQLKRKRKEEDASETKKKKKKQLQRRHTDEAEAEAETKRKIEAKKAKQEAYERSLADYFHFEPFPRMPDDFLEAIPEEYRAGENRLVAFAESVAERQRQRYQRCIKEYMDKDDEE